MLELKLIIFTWIVAMQQTGTSIIIVNKAYHVPLGQCPQKHNNNQFKVYIQFVQKISN